MRWARISLALLLGKIGASTEAQSSRLADTLPATGLLQLVPSCSSRETTNEIVVCGRRSDRYRLPQELRAEPSSASDRPRMPLSANDLAPCGIFQGERRCGKAEAEKYGYGAGRDPITVARKLINAIADPDK